MGSTEPLECSCAVIFFYVVWQRFTLFHLNPVELYFNHRVNMQWAKAHYVSCHAKNEPSGHVWTDKTWIGMRRKDVVGGYTNV